MRSPRMNVQLPEGQGLSLAAWSRHLKRVERVLREKGLSDQAGECELTNEGRTLVLKNPAGEAVFTIEM